MGEISGWDNVVILILGCNGTCICGGSVTWSRSSCSDTGSRSGGGGGSGR